MKILISSEDSSLNSLQVSYLKIFQNGVCKVFHQNSSNYHFSPSSPFPLIYILKDLKIHLSKLQSFYLSQFLTYELTVVISTCFYSSIQAKSHWNAHSTTSSYIMNVTFLLFLLQRTHLGFLRLATSENMYGEMVMQ